MRVIHQFGRVSISELGIGTRVSLDVGGLACDSPRHIKLAPMNRCCETYAARIVTFHRRQDLPSELSGVSLLRREIHSRG